MFLLSELADDLSPHVVDDELGLGRVELDRVVAREEWHEDGHVARAAEQERPAEEQVEDADCPRQSRPGRVGFRDGYRGHGDSLLGTPG